MDLKTLFIIYAVAVVAGTSWLDWHVSGLSSRSGGGSGGYYNSGGSSGSGGWVSGGHHK